MEPEQKSRNLKTIRNYFSKTRLLLIVATVIALAIIIGYVLTQISIAPFSSEPAITFDFDNGFPLLVEKQNTPINQTVDIVTAYFSSPSDTITAPAFSIQSYDTTFLELSQFSGKYLYDNKPSRDILEIRFSKQLMRITLTFATVEYHKEPSNITLTAYMNSIDTVAVGSTTAHGTYQTSLFPQGTLSFNSGDQPFNLVRIEIPYQGPNGATNFFVDNIIITTVQQK